MIISVKRNFLELKNINDLVKKDKPENNYSVKKTKPDWSSTFNAIKKDLEKVNKK